MVPNPSRKKTLRTDWTILAQDTPGRSQIRNTNFLPAPSLRERGPAGEFRLVRRSSKSIRISNCSPPAPTPSQFRLAARPPYRRPTIETEADVEKLAYLLSPVPDENIARFREETAEVKRQADELGVLVAGYGPTGADTIQWLCGPEASILMAMDRPDLFDALMQIVQQRDRRATAILMDTPVDLVIRRGYYEGTSFWSPDLYRRVFMPRIKELVDMIHQADRKIAHAMSVGCMQLLDEFVEAGYDAHHLLDPIPDGVRIDLHKVKTAFKDKIAVIGALNEPITLERGDAKEIRREVRDAIRVLGPGGGLALTPAECICGSTPWNSIEILIDAWKEARDYPLSL